MSEIKKCFTQRKDVLKFRKEYEEAVFDTEVISNLIQPYHSKDNEHIKSFCDFLYPEDKKKYGAIHHLMLSISFNSLDALKDKFGKHDFKFTGNREYTNYILAFEDLKIVAPSKREVVLDEASEKNDFIEKVIRFEKAFFQLVVDYMVQNQSGLKDLDLESLKLARDYKIIDENNKIDFNFNESKKLKKSNKSSL